ncbi:unnamed protein product [Closterium sp. NIES-64]|nr:unnamed protein product [Closterium sp. NIES-64]
MLESLVFSLVGGYLSHYLKNFHKEQLRIGVWRRKIGSLSLQLSMKRLGREPCVSVTISDVLIVMAPRADHEWSEGPAVVRERAAKRAALAAAEVVKMSEQGNGVGASALSYFSAVAAFEFGLHLDHLSVAAAASKDPLTAAAAAAAAAADAIASASASALNTTPAAGGPGGGPGSTASFFVPPDSQTPTEKLLEQQWEQEAGQGQAGGQGKPQIGDAGRNGGTGRNLRKSIEVRGLSFYWNSCKRGFEGSTFGPNGQGGGERTGKEGTEGGERWRREGAVRDGSGERGGEESMDADIVWGEGELVPSDEEEGGGMGAKRQRRRGVDEQRGRGREQGRGKGEEGSAAVANNMLHPLDASIRLVMHMGPPAHTSTAPVSVSLRCNRLRVSLEEHQYQDVLLLADALNVLRLRERYGRFRPAALFSSSQTPPTSGTKPADSMGDQQGGSTSGGSERVRALWSYALNAVLFDVRQRLYRRSFLYLPSRLYVPSSPTVYASAPFLNPFFHTRCLLAPLTSLRAARTEWGNPSASKDSAEDFSAEKDGRGDRRKGKAAQQKQQQQQRGRGWLNWLSQGMLGAGGSDASAAADVMAAVSDRDLEELYRTLDSPFDAADGDNGLDEPSWMSTSASTSSSASMAMDATSASPKAMNRSRSSVHTLSFSESSSSLDASIPEDSSVMGPSSRMLPEASHRTTHGRGSSVGVPPGVHCTGGRRSCLPAQLVSVPSSSPTTSAHASSLASPSCRQAGLEPLRSFLSRSRLKCSLLAQQRFSSSPLPAALSVLCPPRQIFPTGHTEPQAARPAAQLAGAAKGTLDASASFAGPGSQGMRTGVGMGGGVSSERSRISPSSSQEDEAVRILFPLLPHSSLHDFLPPSHPSHPSFHSAASSFASPSTVSSPSPAGHGHLLMRERGMGGGAEMGERGYGGESEVHGWRPGGQIASCSGKTDGCGWEIEVHSPHSHGHGHGHGDGGVGGGEVEDIAPNEMETTISVAVEPVQAVVGVEVLKRVGILVLATRKVLHLHVDVASVTIVVPHADTYLSARPCPLLVLQLASLHISSIPEPPERSLLAQALASSGNLRSALSVLGERALTGGEMLANMWMGGGGGSSMAGAGSAGRVAVRVQGAASCGGVFCPTCTCCSALSQATLPPPKLL